ncbi:Retrovirus-related Pol polyprotein [Senna tora]|uniref:Retrovirus-related Pol polyprotein n=1 Tax=Senna tora TaxID=362788 RepID=A0A834TW02_9FABA|nr:Retrovirus-related Pol polyprotein [Senna tora]
MELDQDPISNIVLNVFPFCISYSFHPFLSFEQVCLSASCLVFTTVPSYCRVMESVQYELPQRLICWNIGLAIKHHHSLLHCVRSRAMNSLWCAFPLTSSLTLERASAVVEATASLFDSFLLKKATGCPSWLNTAPIPVLDASVSTTNCLEKSGRARTSALVMRVFSCLKASSAASFQANWFFFRSSLLWFFEDFSKLLQYWHNSLGHRISLKCSLQNGFSFQPNHSSIPQKPHGQFPSQHCLLHHPCLLAPLQASLAHQILPSQLTNNTLLDNYDPFVTELLLEAWELPCGFAKLLELLTVVSLTLELTTLDLGTTNDPVGTTTDGDFATTVPAGLLVLITSDSRLAILRSIVNSRLPPV